MPDPAGPTPPSPRPIPEILEAAGRICLERPVDYYLVAAVTLLGAWTVNQIVRVLTIGGVSLGALEDPRAPEFLHALGHLLGIGIADGMVYALANSVAGAVLIIMIARRTVNGPSLGGGLTMAAPRFVPAVLATLLFFVLMAGLIGLCAAVTGLPVMGAMAALGPVLDGDAFRLAARLVLGLATLGVMLALGLGILYVWLRWALYPQAVVLEGCGPLAALQRSAALTRDEPGTRWNDRYLTRAAILTAFMVLLQAVVGAVGSAPYGIGLLLSSGEDPSRTSILNPTGMPLALLIPAEIFSVLLRAAVFPFSVAVFLLLYEDVRTHWRPRRSENAGAVRQPLSPEE